MNEIIDAEMFLTKVMTNVDKWTMRFGSLKVGTQGIMLHSYIDANNYVSVIIF